MNKDSFNKSLVLILEITFLHYINLYLYNPILVGYSRLIGCDANMIGMISGAMSFVALFVSPFSGLVVGRYNRRFLIILCFIFYIFASLAFIFGRNAALLLLARCCHGLGFAIMSVALTTTIASVFPNDKTERAIGYFALVQALTQAVAPSLGILLNEKLGFKYASSCCLFASVIGIVVSMQISNFGVSDNNHKMNKITLNSFVSLKLLPIAVCGIIAGFLLQIIQGYTYEFSLFRGYSSGMEVFFTFYAIAMLLSRLLLTQIMGIRKIGEFILPCCSLIIIAMLLIQYQKSAFVLILGGMLFSSGVGILQMKTQSTMARKSDKENLAVANSTFYIAMNLGHSAGGYIGGVLLGSSLSEYFFLLFIPIVFIPIIMSWKFKKLYWS